MNAFDILGSLMKSGMGPSGGRLQNTFGNQGFGGPGGMFGGGAPGGMPGGGLGPGSIFDMLGKMAGSMMGGGGAPAQTGGGLPIDILKQIGGAIFGGSGVPGMGGGGPTAAGAGAMSVFGALAAQALEYARQMMSGAGGPAAGAAPGVNVDDATAIIAGLRKPSTEHDVEKVQDIAKLTVRAMLNAAKADGRIDEQEAHKLVGKMEEDGITDDERKFVMQELEKPMETEAIVREVPNQQVAAQIYTASLMAIQVDTDAERRYMQELSSKLGLNQQTVAYLHQAVGLA